MILCLAWTFPAHAEDGPGDGAYHRLDRPLKFSLSAGPAWQTNGEASSFGLSVDARARVFNAAGPVVALEWSPERAYAFVGVEVRPLFPALFLLDLSSGHQWLDLFIQSVGVELGAVFSLDPSRGVGLGAGVSLTVPLVLPSAGVFGGVGLRLAARRVDGTATFQSGPEIDTSEWTLSATLEVVLGARLRAVSSDDSPPGLRRR